MLFGQATYQSYRISLQWAESLTKCPLTLKPATGGYFTPQRRFCRSSQTCKTDRTVICWDIVTIIWGFENRWVHVNIYIRFIRTRPELQVKSWMVCQFH